MRDWDRALTYGELATEAGGVAAGLTADGVADGDRVALLLGNSVDWVVAALGCLWVGAMFVPLAAGDPEARLTAILDDCGPKLVVTADRSADLLRGRASTAVSELRLGVGSEPAQAPAAERACYVIYTSGTTGAPKGVVIGTRAFSAAVREASNAVGFDRETKALCVSPFHFDGSFGTLFPTLWSGGTLVLRPRDALLFPRTFFNAVIDEAITLTSFSPSYLRLLLSAPEVATLRGSTLRTVAVGGEASSAADIEALWSAAPHLRVFNRYGPTETAIAVAHIELTRDVLAGGTVPIGQPHPGVTFHLIDEEGRKVDRTDRVGELYIGGRQLMTGYWNAPELTSLVMRSDVVPGETVYRSGDLMYRDTNSNYVYVDRADRVIKRHGVRISLVELSEVVRALDGVRAAACVAFDDGGRIAIAAFAVTRPAVTEIDLRRGARLRLPESMLPDRFEILDALPMTGASKLDERRLLAEAGLREWHAGGAPTASP